MRPQTPNLATGMRKPTSPPETPPPGSPAFTRAKGANGRASPAAKGAGRFSQSALIGGVGSQFNGTRGGVRPEAISPQESTSSDEEESDDSDDDSVASDASDSPPQSPASYVPRVETWSTIQAHLASTGVEVEETFTVVEQDEDDMESDDGDDGGNPPLLPDSYEYPESSGSGSPSTVDQEVPEDVLDRMTNMNCGAETDTTAESDYDDEDDDDEDEEDDEEYMQHIRFLREQRRLRRMTSGSISKRTVSERGSDSDREDLQPYDLGDSTQRRLRRKFNRNRLSVISNPQNIIIELAEPNSDDDMSGDDGDGDGLFQFWRLMEVDDA
ncbi:hypothetical protein PG999_014119 [Apiospora kogelbergensis]|uniref:Uncharacterized protein n=1 Tax=Apiospora kogelbergensis TaxID=1337665 RepID=A0AAW0Q8T5_9PEZI